MLIVKYASHRAEEKNYIVNIILDQILGVQYQTVIDDEIDGYELILPNESKVILPDRLFLLLNTDSKYTDDIVSPRDVCWIKPCSYTENDLPILFGTEKIETGNNSIVLGGDIFGTCFFLITGLDEFISHKRDKHHRFPAKESLAYKHNFLDRPVVDEIANMLWIMLTSLDITIIRNVSKSKSKLSVTCDVDWPYDPRLVSVKHALVASAIYLIKKKDLIAAIKCLSRYVLNTIGFKQVDSYRKNITWMMDENEKNGNIVSFFFIPNKTSKLDTLDTLDSGKLTEIIKEVSSRGHFIGMHPGYNTSLDNDYFSQAASTLERVLKNVGVNQSEKGSRQHFLMWDIRTTPQHLDSMGIDFDTSLGFAELAGFRCGTAHEFIMFDLVNQKPLRIKQKPLIAMESSVIAQRYEGLGYTQASMERFLLLKSRAVQFGGTFTLLWHNCHFDNIRDKEFYKELIK